MWLTTVNGRRWTARVRERRQRYNKEPPRCSTPRRTGRKQRFKMQPEADKSAHRGCKLRLGVQRPPRAFSSSLGPKTPSRLAVPAETSIDPNCAEIGPPPLGQGPPVALMPRCASIGQPHAGNAGCAIWTLAARCASPATPRAGLAWRRIHWFEHLLDAGGQNYSPGTSKRDGPALRVPSSSLATWLQLA